MHFTLFVHLFALQRAFSVGSKTKMLRPRPGPKLQDQDQKYKTETGLVIRPRSQIPTAPRSEDPKLINRVITFELIQWGNGHGTSTSRSDGL